MKEQARAASGKTFEIWQENWLALEMFLRLSTQWVVTQGGFVGLNYSAVSDIFRLYRIKDKQKLFEDVQVMERAALRVINEGAA